MKINLNGGQGDIVMNSASTPCLEVERSIQDAVMDEGAESTSNITDRAITAAVEAGALVIDVLQASDHRESSEAAADELKPEVLAVLPDAEHGPLPETPAAPRRSTRPRASVAYRRLSDNTSDRPAKKRSRTPECSTTPKRKATTKRAQAEDVTLYPQGLPPVEATVNNEWLYVYFRFCSERHRMFDKREEGVSRAECTTDETMLKTVVGNVFRELDRGSSMMCETIIGVGDQSHEEICFRLFLFHAFFEAATWEALVEGLGETPSWKNFDLKKYEAILHERSFVRKQVIYTSGFQLVPPTIYFGRNLPHYAASLRFVKSLMEMDLPAQLLKCKYAVDASQTLQTIPTLGGFLSWNLVNDLNASPHLHFAFRNYASCGPGSRAYLQKIFGKSTINSVPMELAGLQWLYDNQWRYWTRLGVDPPHAWRMGLRPGMRVVDFENSLCWCKRYVNDYTNKGYASVADAGWPEYGPEAEEAGMPAWCEEERQVGSYSAAAFDDAYDEVQARKAAEEDGTYEVDRIVCRKRSRTDKDGLFRVRWKGYTPEHDTWERASSLMEGAEEALQEWLDWESSVFDTIDRVGKENPWSSPDGVKVEVQEVQEAPVRTSARKRKFDAVEVIIPHATRATRRSEVKAEHF